MPEMTNPMSALIQLQAALDERIVYLHRCAIHRELCVLADQPNGRPRITYASVKGGVVQAVALVVLTEPIEGIPCFQLGYAVIESVRGRGLATEIVTRAIDELRNGMKGKGVETFYLEAVISASNLPSNKLSKRLLSDSPVSCVDNVSGEPAFQYLKKVG